MDISCFISVNLPDDAKTAIDCIITELRKTGQVSDDEVVDRLERAGADRRRTENQRPAHV